ncbi:MAG: mechanosensitive ion channel [Planctomycetes bacterium]|nr:mechanosensitive ion channel [Planctomycetota bacterium]
MKRFGLVVALLLAPVFVIAQDPQPQPQPEPLPELPAAPYVREHADALKKHIASAKQDIASAELEVTRAQAASAEEGLTPEEKGKRDEALQQAEARVVTLNGQLDALQVALKQADTGPTTEQLTARQEYDRLYALTEQVRKDLTLLEIKTDDSGQTTQPEGDYAKAVRLAEEEQERIRTMAAKAQDFEFAKSRVYEKLSDLEKVEYEIRWATQRFQLSVDAYDHMADTLFGAYKSYEMRAFGGMKAATDAQAAWKKVAGTPAESLDLDGQPRDEKRLKSLREEIDKLRGGRVGESRGPFWIRAFEGRLQEVQREIDDRENYLERLEQDAEKLKAILAENGSKAAPPEPEEGATPVSEPEEYQKLGEKIDEFETKLKENRLEIERLQKERVDLETQLAAKQQVEEEVADIAEKTQLEIDAIVWQFTKAAVGEAKPPKPEYEVPTYYERPRGLIFTLRERLKAENERLGAAKRDSRQVQTQMEIVDRRIVSLNERNQEIETMLLPETRERYYEEIGKTIGVRALKVVGVLLVAWFILFLIRKIGEPLIEGIVKRADKKKGFSADEQQRARTLMTVFMTTARVVVYITAIMFAIAQFDVDYGPLLVAAGGVSLAVGFGAQTLVKDFFAGFFILLEGQFSIGDVIEINGKTGTVENLGLRTTVIRSLNGDVHTIPNGEISVTTNQTKLWSRSVIDIGIGYEENADEVGQVLEAVAKEMREVEPWDKKVLDAIYMGVAALGDSSVNLRMLLKTRAGEQWGAAREFNRRVKAKFDELGIEIPWPQRVISYKSDTDEKTQAQEDRKKRANLLRYVRKMRGEVTEEEAELAKLSVEERDRAETMANHEAGMAQEKSKDGGASEPAAKVGEAAEEDHSISDAEKFAKKLATRQINKDESEQAAVDGTKPAAPDEDKK